MAAPVHLQRRLIDLLAETGPMPAEQAGALLQELAVRASPLLAEGRLAEQLCIENIWTDDRLQPFIVDSDDKIDVNDMTASTKQTVESGASPERAAIFQLGCIACELFTGETADAYLVSPRVKSQIPAAWRPIVDRMLGYDPARRIATLEELHVEFGDVSEPQHVVETPRHGTGVDVTGNTPLAGRLAAAPRTPEPAAEALPFSMLGHYRVEARIGSGGMGDVYRGFEAALDRTVALKVLPVELARQPDFVRRFEDEAKAAARLVHPNIVQIYFIGEDAGRHFFAMQYVAGESLASRLAREKRLPTAEALALVEQLLDGLSVAHVRGMIHRDIKPSNILLDAEHGRALLADFGLVKSLDGGTQLTATGMVMGTVDYLSPEQGRGLAVDARSDLYSVGVLLYQLLSGRLPFASDSPTAMIFQHAYERPRPLTDVAPFVPEGVARLVHRLLEKEPRDRYANAEELLVDVRGLRASAAYNAPPQSTGQFAVHSLGWLSENVDDQRTAPFPELPAANWRDRWRLLLHQRAPRLLQRLQNTDQQMDGALAVYQARCDQLLQLVDEAAAMKKQLAADIQEERRRGDGSSAGELEQTLAEHQAQLDDLRLRKAQADATLEKLRNQQAVLRARMQVAAAGQALAGTGGRSRGAGWRRARPWLLLAAVVFGFGILRNPRPEQLPTPLPVTHAPTSPVFSSWVDLLPVVQLPEDVLGGNWKFVRDGLKIDNPSGAQRLRLPVRIQGSYELRLQFTRGNGAPNRGLSISFPVEGRRANVVLGQVSGRGVGIAGINRLSAFHDANPAADKRMEVQPDVKHDALISVRLDGPMARIAVTLDDVQRVEWSGQQWELNLPTISDEPLGDVPILAAWGNDVTFHHIDFRAGEGAATLLRGDALPHAPDALPPRQPVPPSTLEGQFHVACKGSFELLVNGRPVLASSEQESFAGTSERVALKDGDVVSVRVNSKYVYRAFRLAFIDVSREWLWSARREDFRVLENASAADADAELVVASSRLPAFGRVDLDSATVDSWDLLLENDVSDWLWAGGKNEWAMFSAVVRPQLFAPYSNVIPAHRSRWEPAQNAGAVVNSPADDAGPFLTADGKTLLFHSNRDGGDGGDGFDLYISRREALDQAWQAPASMGESLNSAAIDLFPRMSTDGLSLLFYSTREGGHGRGDMYQASRASIDEPWGQPTPLPAPLNTEYDDGPGWLSPDGRAIWFNSDRPSGEGKSDVWYSQRTTVNDQWSEPSVVRSVNTSSAQRHPSTSADGQLLLFDARWTGGFGQADIWSWRRSTTPLSRSPLNLGATINSKATEADPALSLDGKSLWFSSNRPGGQGKLDLWFASAGRSRLQPPPTGTWKMLLPSGAQRAVTLAATGNGTFELRTGGALSGVYTWRDGSLTVTHPQDPRYVDLIWEWQGDKLVLVSEPSGRPSGSAYLGASLEFASKETSTEARNTIPTLPARSSRSPKMPSS